MKPFLCAVLSLECGSLCPVALCSCREHLDAAPKCMRTRFHLSVQYCVLMWQPKAFYDVKSSKDIRVLDIQFCVHSIQCAQSCVPFACSVWTKPTDCKGFLAPYCPSRMFTSTINFCHAQSVAAEDRVTSS